MLKYLSAFFVIAIHLSLSSAISLKDKLIHAQTGAYIVTLQNKNYSLLHLHSVGDKTITLEEINIPSAQLPAKHIDWKKWLADEAPWHSSWLMYELDLDTNCVVECFSFTKNAWLTFDHSDSFLAKLMTLNLHTVAPDDLRRIGPPPSSGEADTRMIWTPPLFRNGQKISTKFEAYHSTWPKDGTEFAGKKFLFYFEQNTDFPFPCWMQISDGSNSLKIRAVDSGIGMKSPQRSIPRRPPQFIGSPKSLVDHVQLRIRIPSYLTDIEIFAQDVNNFGQMIPLSFTLHADKEKEKYTLQIDKENLRQVLVKDHRYYFIAIPKDGENLFAESNDPWRY